MAWQATVDTVARDGGTGTVTIDMTLSDGVDSIPYQLIYQQDDPTMTPTNVRRLVMEELGKKSEYKANFVLLKAQEGNTFP